MSGGAILAVWLLVNLLALLVAVRRAARRAPVRTGRRLAMGGMQGRGDPALSVRAKAPDRLSLAVAAHVHEATPGVVFSRAPMAGYVERWAAVAREWRGAFA